MIYFAIHANNKELLSRAHKQRLYSNMTNNPIENWIKDFNGHFQKEILTISIQMKISPMSLLIQENPNWTIVVLLHTHPIDGYNWRVLITNVRIWRTGKIILCWWDCKLPPPLWKPIFAFSMKGEHTHTTFFSIPLLGTWRNS